MLEASRLLDEVKNFLDINFEGFKYFEPQRSSKKLVFFRNFEKPRLSIVIILPIIKDSKGGMIFSGKTIKTVLKTTKGKERIYLKDTLLKTGMTEDNWKYVLGEKLSALKELVALVGHCRHCGSMTIPTMCISKEGVNFVSMRCPGCNRWKNTTYGIGLKTILHKNLKERNMKR